MIFKRLISFSILCLTFLQISAQKYIIATVRDVLGNPIPYASVIINTHYGIIADSSGRFKVFDYDKNNPMKVVSTGFKIKQLGHHELRNNPEIILEKIKFREEETHTARNIEILGYPGKGKMFSDPFTINSNYEAGVLFPYPGRKAYLSKIKIHAGFRGNPILPVRVNIYRLDEKGLPFEIILKKEIIFLPEKITTWHEFDISGQAIPFPESGVAITLEPLNVSLNRIKLRKDFCLVISQYTPKDEAHMVLRHEVSGGWFNWLKKPYAISMEISY